MCFKTLKMFTAVRANPAAELRSVTCHVGPHSVACYPTQVNAPCLNPSQSGWYSIYLPKGMEGWVDLGDW